MFLLVPAHLGCPGQNPESRKMVVCCVCVCVCVCESLSDNANLMISNKVIDINTKLAKQDCQKCSNIMCLKTIMCSTIKVKI